jgi:multiple antibiotic resistance protein
MNFTAFIGLFISLLAIANPIGALGIFIGLTADYSSQEKKQLAKQAGIAISIILIIVAWLGKPILHFFGITPAAFEVAGAIVILLIGLAMVRGEGGTISKKSSGIHFTEEEKVAAKEKDSIAVVPIALPIAAGPGAITAIIIDAQKFNAIWDHVLITLLVILISLIIFFCLYFAEIFNKLIGINGIKVVTRIMGLIVIAIAIQMIADAIDPLMTGMHRQ